MTRILHCVRCGKDFTASNSFPNGIMIDKDTGNYVHLCLECFNTLKEKEDKEKMANVNTETTITLSAEEKDLFETAIKKLEDIVQDIHNNTDLFVDADSVFACINDTYRQNGKKMPTVVHIWE